MNDELDTVALSVHGHVATVTLNRPERLNSVTARMEVELHDLMSSLDADPAVRVIVLTGAGRAFCAGMDMEELADLAPADIYDPAKMRPFKTGMRADFQGRYTYFPSLSKPVIASLNGATAGLGMIFALSSDMRFASEKAVFSSAFSRRGLIGEHGSAWLLTSTIGPGKAADVLMSARRIEARDALSMGLVDRLYPPEELASAVAAYAGELASAVSPRSLKVIKRQLWEARFQGLADAVRLANAEMVESFGSEDFREGVAHFVEKRAAAFTGR